MERAQRAGEAITLFRAEVEEKESWKLAKGWYRQVTERPSKPYHRFMTRQTKEREELYTRWEPPGDPIPCTTARPPLEDGTRLDAELRAAVKKLCNGRAEGGSTMWVKDLKARLKGMEQEEKAAKESEGGTRGRGTPGVCSCGFCSTRGTRGRSRGRCSCPWWC